MKPRQIFVRALVALAAAGLFQACGDRSDADLIANAKTYLEQKNGKAAIIQLKTALQRNPQNGEARYLLGQALLDSGDAVAASVELRKAAELKYQDTLVVPALARALLLQGEDRRVSEAYASVTLPDARANASLKTTLASAYIRQDKPELAEAAVAEALASVPRYQAAMILKARMTAGKADFPAALALLDEVTADDPAQAEAWLLKGQLQQHGLHDDAAALVSYRKAAEARNDLISAHEGVVSLLIAARDLDGADAHVAQLKKTLPNNPGTRFMEAQMAFLHKDFQATREIATPLLQRAPNNPLLLQLAGAAEYYLKALPQAENLLAQAVKLAPGSPLATQLLARTYLRTGQPEKALETLRPTLEAKQPSTDALLAAGEAYLQMGDARHAEDAFARAARARPDDPRARTAMALVKVGKGDSSTGIAELASVSAADSGVTADMALIATHLRNNDLDKALKAVDQLQRKQPDRPLAANLRGRILMLRKDASGARASFERALALDPAYFPAIASLAALDLAEKKPDAARKRFDDLLRTDPKNTRAMLALAALTARAGGSPQETTDLIANAVRVAPSEPMPRLRLIDYQLGVGNTKAALAAAQDAVAALPANRDLLHALGRAQLASADFQQAVTSFNKLASLQPNSTLALMGLAEAYVGVKDYAAAERSLKRVLEINPKLLAAQRGLVGLLSTDGRYPEALAVAATVQKQRPTEAAGYQLEGDVELLRRNWDNAIAAYRSSLQKAPSGESAALLHRALGTAGRNDEAERFAVGWQKEHPRDIGFRFYLGDIAMAKGDWALAETRYREVLRVQPDNALALNNTAWLLLKQGKPGALPFAEKAIALLPGPLALQDTLALALADDNQLPRALAVQQKALERAPEDPSLRLTLARLYLKSGDKTQARAELDKLSKLGRKFRDQAEVTELLKGV